MRTGLNWETHWSSSRFIPEIKISATQLHFKVPGQASRLRWTGLGPGAPAPCFSFGAPSGPLSSLYFPLGGEVRKVQAVKEKEGKTRSTRMKGGVQKHWRQNAFHSHSGGRPEVPYFFCLARLFAIISSTLSSLRRGIWRCRTLSDRKAAHECL